MFAVRVSPYAACFTQAQPCFELNQFYLRRAWGMTAKAGRYQIARSLAWPMPFVAGNKTPREAGSSSLKKMAKQQAAYGETGRASLKPKRAMPKTLNQNSLACYELPTALTTIARLGNSKAVSAMARLGWPPAREKGARISGQNKKRSEAADLEFQQGSLGGGARV